MFSILKQIIKQPCIAVDLGTANTRIYSSELGQIREKTSVIPQVTDSKTTVVSDEYLSYLNSKLVAVPLRGGVIVDLKKAIILLQPLLRETKKVLRHPIALASAPTDTSDKERELLARAVRHAGASHVAIVPEVWAAAIGAGIDVTLPYAQVLIDIGDGVTDMAVIRDSRLVCSSAVRTACSDLQKAIRSTIMVKHKVYLGFPESHKSLYKLMV